MSREEVSTGLPVGRSLEPFGRTHRGALGSGRRRRRFDIGMVSRIGEWILHREPTVVVLAVSMQELFRGQRGFEYIYINKLRGRDHERSNVGRDTPLSFAVQEIVAPRQTRCHQENLLEKQKDRNDEASTTSLQCWNSYHAVLMMDSAADTSDDHKLAWAFPEVVVVVLGDVDVFNVVEVVGEDDFVVVALFVVVLVVVVLVVVGFVVVVLEGFVVVVLVVVVVFGVVFVDVVDLVVVVVVVL
jgi:hypothetical protein